MSAQAKAQKSVVKEASMRKIPIVPVYSDETEDGISLLNPQISNAK